jgi:hypothetical protein
VAVVFVAVVPPDPPTLVALALAVEPPLTAGLDVFVFAPPAPSVPPDAISPPLLRESAWVVEEVLPPLPDVPLVPPVDDEPGPDWDD